jgi:hypothetical protein
MNALLSPSHALTAASGDGGASLSLLKQATSHLTDGSLLVLDGLGRAVASSDGVGGLLERRHGGPASRFELCPPLSRVNSSRAPLKRPATPT